MLAAVRGQGGSRDAAGTAEAVEFGGQAAGAHRLGLADIAGSPIDWRVPAPGDVAVEVELNLHAKKQPRPLLLAHTRYPHSDTSMPSQEKRRKQKKCATG